MFYKDSSSLEQRYPWNHTGIGQIDSILFRPEPQVPNLIFNRHKADTNLEVEEHMVGLPWWRSG